jgi:Transposase DDE domain
VAQTGHILRLKHRPGNVHDSKQAVPILRGRFGPRVVLEFPMDAAFFQRGILQLLAARECGFAIKADRLPSGGLTYWPIRARLHAIHTGQWWTTAIVGSQSLSPV